MNRRSALLTLGLPVILQANQILKPEDSKKEWLRMTSAGFSILYYLGEVKSKTEIRMVDQIDLFSEEMTGKKIEKSFNGLLTSDGIDVAGLVARAGERSKITNTFLDQFLETLLSNENPLPPMMCYRPHHIIVSYTEQGIPIAALEVCLNCNVWDAYPRIPHSGSGNLLGIAKLIHSLGIPLGPDFPNIKSYEDHSAALREPISNSKK